MEGKFSIELTVEVDEQGFWGSMWLGDKLIVEKASSQNGLILSVKKLLYDFYKLEPDEVHLEVIQEHSN